MKYNPNKFIKMTILFLMISTLISGCVQNEKYINDSESPPNPSNTNSPDITDSTTLPDNFERVNTLSFAYLADNHLKYNNIAIWQNYINEKFGIELYVDYTRVSANYLLEGKTVVDDILYLNFPRELPPLYPAEVFKYGEESIAYELSPYYEKYGWDKYVDKEYLDSLKTAGGIYAVPAANSKYIVPRYYNKDFLEEVQQDIPTNTDSLYEFLKASKNLKVDDPQFYPMCLHYRSLTRSTADIFRAFDVFVNSSWNTTITFNPNTGTFEDGVYAENMELALEYIRKLQHEDLMFIYGFSQYGSGQNGEALNRFVNNPLDFSKEFATEYNTIYNTKRGGFSSYTMGEPNYAHENGYYLTHLNSRNVCEVRSDLAFYVFPKAIENINGVIDLFNDIFTDSSYYADLRYGIENTDYVVMDGYPILNLPEIGSLIDLKPIKPVEYANASFVPESIKILDGLSKDIIFEKNVFNFLKTYIDISSYHINFDNNVDLLFHKRVSPYDAIEEYKKEFKKAGRIVAIDELNEKLGTIATYDYGN